MNSCRSHVLQYAALLLPPGRCGPDHQLVRLLSEERLELRDAREIGLGREQPQERFGHLRVDEDLGGSLLHAEHIGGGEDPLGQSAATQSASVTPWNVNGPDGQTSNILSRLEHGDVELHVEFMVPKGSNSGVYLQGRYEVQVLGSHGDPDGLDTCGAIYGVKQVDRTATRPPQAGRQPWR